MTLRILISNDDGVFARGVRCLAVAAVAAGHKVTVVCPDRERSASGHGLTIQEPIRAEHIGTVLGDSIEAWSCSGTPSDCVKIALAHLLPTPVDLVLSGINHGLNLGRDVLYSGTVAAAMEGTMKGLPAMAISSHSRQLQLLNAGAERVVALAQRVLTTGWPPGLLLNVNLPGTALTSHQAVQWCRPCADSSRDDVEVHTNPDGQATYLLKLAATRETHAAAVGPEDWLTDRDCVESGGIAVTPLQPQLFWRGAITALPKLSDGAWRGGSARAMDTLQQPEAADQANHMGHEHLGVAQD